MRVLFVLKPLKDETPLVFSILGVDAMPVGSCGAGQRLDKCRVQRPSSLAWGNFNTNGGFCKKGQSIGVSVSAGVGALHGCPAARGYPLSRPRAVRCAPGDIPSIQWVVPLESLPTHLVSVAVSVHC